MIFISRKLFGVGGMQRWSSDVKRGLRACHAARGRHSVHLGDAGLSPVGWILKKAGMRVTVTAHGLDVVWGRSWYQWMIRHTLPMFDRVVCVSRATASCVRERGVSHEKIVVIPCGIWWTDAGKSQTNPKSDSSRRRPEPKSEIRNLKLLSVGRLVRRKGHVWFIQSVLPLLVERYPNLQYWIVGKGPEEARIRECVYGNVLENHVRLYGRVSDEERDALLDQADLFVMPNIPVEGDMEGFGIACIEASGRGVPVVASRLDGLEDAVVEGATGGFFEAGNADDCVRVIQNMFQYPLPASHVTRHTLERYAWPRIFHRYHNEVFSS